MRVSRRLSVFFLVLCVIITIPTQAMCVRCDSANTCWGGSGTASKCESYGTSCVTAGTCTPSEGDGADVYYQSLATPLNLEYKVAEVKIERPGTKTERVAVAKTMLRAGKH